MRTKGLGVISLLVAFGLILAACQPAPPAAPAVEKKVVTGMVGYNDIPTLDPGLAEDTSAITVVNATNIGLTWLDETNATLHPGMAESWDISENGKTYTFHLRQGIPWVKWDGENVVEVTDCQETPGARPVTAYDFEYGIKRALAPETASPYAYVLAFALQGAAAYNAGEADAEAVAVKALDNYTLQVTFLEDVAYNANIIGLWTAHAVPKWIIEGDDCTDARGDRWFEPGFFQGFGPFVLKDWVHDSDITIMKNPFWPGTAEIPQPMVDEVKLFFLDAVPAFAEYEAGNLDFTEVPLADIDRVKADPVLSKEYKQYPWLCTYYYGFNTKAPFVDDVRVRRALSMAVDRQSLIDNVTKGGQEPAQWFSRPGLVAAPTMDSHPDLGVKYDPVAAKASLDEYLAEKGITAADVDLTLMFNTSSGHQKIAEAIQQMWRETLGLEVKLTNQEWQVFLDTTKDPVNTPQIYRMGWCVDYPDANNFIREVFAYGGSQNPSGGGGINWGPGDANYDEFETLVKEAAAEQDPAKRLDMYAQAEEILVMTDAVIAPWYWYTNNVVTKPYITRTYPVTGHNDFTFWDTSK